MTRTDMTRTPAGATMPPSYAVESHSPAECARLESA
jgi:hypothetical protein